MANRPANFAQSDLTKVLKAYRDAGLPPPQIVIEPRRITVTPVNGATTPTAPNPWDAA